MRPRRERKVFFNGVICLIRPETATRKRVWGEKFASVSEHCELEPELKASLSCQRQSACAYAKESRLQVPCFLIRLWVFVDPQRNRSEGIAVAVVTLPLTSYCSIALIPRNFSC